MRRVAGEEHVLSTLLDSWTSVPALVYDRHLNVLAANTLANRVLKVRVGDNLLKVTFLACDVDRGTAIWEAAAAAVVGALHESLAINAEDDAFLEMVGELAATSAHFPQLWADSEGSATSEELICVIDDKPVTLRYTKLVTDSLPGHTVLVWHPVNAAARRTIRVGRGDR